MKLTRRDLRRIIQEETAHLIDECPNPETDMPCPIHTASEMRSANAGAEDVLHWVQLLISEFMGGHEEVMPEEEFSFTGDVGELGDEAFALDISAGQEGLT